MLKEFVEVVKTKVSMGKLGSIACGSSTGRSWARRGPQPREVYSLERLQLGSYGLPGYKAITHTGQAAWAGEGSQIVEQPQEVTAATS